MDLYEVKVSKTLIMDVYCQDGTVSMDTASKKGDEEDGKKRQKRVPVGKKIYYFFNAPYTKFWFNTVCEVKTHLKNLHFVVAHVYNIIN